LYQSKYYGIRLYPLLLASCMFSLSVPDAPRGLIKEFPRIKDQHVLEAFGTLPPYSGDKDYSCHLHIFCRRGCSLPHGRGVVTLYKRGRDWRVGGIPNDSDVASSLEPFLKNPVLFALRNYTTGH
jgi:hypothetical protein